MTVRVYLNNLAIKLAQDIITSDTSFDVDDASAIAAVVSSTNHVILTIDDLVNKEIVKCTGVSSNTLTVVRAQEGTSAHNFLTNTKVQCRHTAFSYSNPQWTLVSVSITSGTPATVTIGNLAGTHKVEFEHLIASANRVRVGYSNGTIDSGTNYNSATYSTSTTSTNYRTRNVTGTTFVNLDDSGEPGTRDTRHGCLVLNDTTFTGYNSFYGDTSYVYSTGGIDGIYVTRMVGMWVDNTHAITDVQFLCSAGNHQANSKFYLYKRNVS